MMILYIAFGILLTGGTIFILKQRKVWIVPEDNVAVTINKDGFIRRVLPAGKHRLGLKEMVDFSLDTRPKLATGQVMTLVTGDGISINIHWSGVFSVQPLLVKEKLNQRLRGLTNAEKAINRNVDIALRKLVGDYTLQDLFKPNLRERIERQLHQVVAGQVKPLAIVLLGLNLQEIELPDEVAEALNKAKAIQTLDGTIRQLDPTTREVIRGAYHLDEILHWDQYLPVPSRLAAMKKQEMMSS